MHFLKSALITFLLGSGSVLAVDFTKFSDICEPTETQTCPNKPNEVKALQEALNADPELYMYIKTDGKWTKGMKEAVVIFQEHYHISPANGYIGTYTKKILQKMTHPNAVVKNNSTSAIATKSTSDGKRKVLLPDVTPTREFVLYGDMCDNSISGNHCPNKLIEVSNLQILLNADHNLNVNITADGRWGPGTQKAVVEFQKAYGISPAQGYVGLRTKKILDRVAGAMVAKAAVPVKYATSKKTTTVKSNKPIMRWKNICERTATDNCSNLPEDVKSLQAFLNKSLGLRLSVDGKWGNGTKQAVIKFQKKNHINPANGYVGPKTKRIMYRFSKKKVSRPRTKAKVKNTAKRPIKTYAQFKKHTNYPKTYKVFKDRKLLSRANGRNTKVKIDISEQRMKLYVGNKIALDSPCTTGSKHKLEPNTKVIRDKRTPKGTFKITEKISKKRSTIFGDIYIRGKKVYHGDRRKYKGTWKGAKFVGAALHDWMRLTSSGIGMHGSKYVKRYPGSNGCIRLPFSVARTVFRKVRPGTKVRIVN